jgi:hypothetical protein
MAGTKDKGGQVRKWPGPTGTIRKNPDLGEGPYSQSNGLPYGGVSAKEFINKTRKNKKKKSKAYYDINNLSFLFLKMAEKR